MSCNPENEILQQKIIDYFQKEKIYIGFPVGGLHITYSHPRDAETKYYMLDAVKRVINYDEIIFYKSKKFIHHTMQIDGEEVKLGYYVVKYSDCNGSVKYGHISVTQPGMKLTYNRFNKQDCDRFVKSQYNRELLSKTYGEPKKSKYTILGSGGRILSKHDREKYISVLSDMLK